MSNRFLIGLDLSFNLKTFSMPEEKKQPEKPKVEQPKVDKDKLEKSIDKKEKILSEDKIVKK